MGTRQRRRKGQLVNSFSSTPDLNVVTADFSTRGVRYTTLNTEFCILVAWRSQDIKSLKNLNKTSALVSVFQKKTVWTESQKSLRAGRDGQLLVCCDLTKALLPSAGNQYQRMLLCCCWLLADAPTWFTAPPGE